ncbi:MAG: alcohol dehydrogenase catalytic domain-containing protein [Spirochaetales bacterium]|nr:alcohol dehydrogenase catalytic domain-containing protein [Spirochaetales bacterium]
MKALFARKGFEFKIEESEPRKPGRDEVLVKVHACGVCGTDLHFARDWSEGWAPLGHEIAAEVLEVGEGNVPYRPGEKVIVEDVALCGVCEDCKSGRTQFCRNMYDLGGQPGMAETLTVNHHLLDRLDGISWEHATLVEPLAVAYNMVLKAKIPLGGNVVVMGPGPIGLMCVRLVKMRGAARVVLVGTTHTQVREAARFEVGREFGADEIVEAVEEDAVARVREIFPKGADSVLVTSPPATLPQGIRLSRFGGTVTFIGINLGGRSRVEVDVNELIFNKISLVPTFAEPAQNFPETIKLLQRGLVGASRLVTTTFGFEEAREVFMRSDNGEEPIIKAVLVPGK